MKFLVYDRKSVERGIVVRTAYVLISIRDPDRPPVRTRRPPGLLDVLSLAFHDAEPIDDFPLPAEVRLMQSSDATRIWQLVRKYRDQIGTIICHCEQGMSRSPAVALALAEALDGDADAILAESQPNQYVYDLMRETILQFNEEN